MKSEKGITLVAMIITIIVLLIIAGISISTTFIMSSNAKKSAFQTDLSSMIENFQTYKAAAITHNYSYTANDLNWNGKDMPENTGKITNKEDDDGIDVILGVIPKRFVGKVTIQNGELVFSGMSIEENGWIKEIINSNVGESVEKPPIEEESPESRQLVKFLNGSVMVEGLSIQVAENGEITLNGEITSNKKYFIKLSDGIEVEELKNGGLNSNEIFEQWTKDKKPIITSGKYIKQTITKESGEIDTTGKEQINVALRDSSYQAIMNCKLNENIYSTKEFISNDVVASYIYISRESGTLNLKNVKLKIGIEEINKEVPDKLPLQPETKTFENLKVTINDDSSITIDGKAKEKTFIKMTYGIEFKTNNVSDGAWANSDDLLAFKGKNVQLAIQEINGIIEYEQETGEFNCALRDSANTAAINIKMHMAKLDENKTIKSAITKLEYNVTTLYAFISKGTTFKGYTFIPSLNVIE